MSHSPVPRIWTLHFFNHSIKVTLSRASHSQIIRPDSVSHKTRILITSAFSSSLKRFSNRETSWRVMQAITWVETNLGIFNYILRFGQVDLKNSVPLRRPAETPKQKPYAGVAGYRFGVNEHLFTDNRQPITDC